MNRWNVLAIGKAPQHTLFLSLLDASRKSLLVYFFSKFHIREVRVTTCISAVQHLRRLRGGAQSHLLRASDGAVDVTKFQNNPQHIRVLANEMLATRLGLALGLPMPTVEAIEVRDWLIEHTEDLRIDLGGGRIPCRSGRQLGS